MQLVRSLKYTSWWKSIGSWKKKFLLVHYPFLLLFFLGGKIKRVRNNQLRTFSNPIDFNLLPFVESIIYLEMSNFAAANTSDYNIISVIGNGHHCNQWAGSKHSSKATIPSTSWSHNNRGIKTERTIKTKLPTNFVWTVSQLTLVN